MIRLFFTFVAWLALANSMTSLRGDSAVELPSNLKSTIQLYLSAETGYLPGDLITRSHLKDIQRYLRQTQGNCAATQPKWRIRLLPDTAPLARFFYSGGASVLRKAAAKVGSYAQLDRLSRSANGRQQLQRAIDRNSPAELIQFLLAEQAESLGGRPSPGVDAPLPPRPMRIYTAEEFLTAVAAPLPAAPVANDPVSAASQAKTD